jgi:hypothetical protein
MRLWRTNRTACLLVPVLAALLRVPLAGASLLAFDGNEPGAKPLEVVVPDRGSVGKPAPEKLRRALLARTSITADKVPLRTLIKNLADEHKVLIRLDEPALKEAGLTSEAPVTATIKNFTLRAALMKILNDLELQFVAADGALLVTTAKGASQVAAQQSLDEAESKAPAQRPEGIIRGQPAMTEIEVNEKVKREFEQQRRDFERRIRPLLLAELSLVERVCLPTPRQRTQMQAESAEVLDRIFETNRIYGPRVRAAIESAVEALVARRCSAEQAELYRAELARRQADRRAAAIQNLVARADRELFLSASQREALARSLTENWHDEWQGYFEACTEGIPNLPEVPQVCLQGILSESQQTIWNGLTRDNVQRMAGQFNNPLVNVRVLDGKALPERGPIVRIVKHNGVLKIFHEHGVFRLMGIEVRPSEDDLPPKSQSENSP